MIHILRSVGMLLVSIFTIAPVAHAGLDSYQPIPVPGFSTTTHSYQVRFDGEGEANVVASISYQNTNKEDVTSFAFTIPGKAIRVTQAVEQVTVETTAPCKDGAVCTQTYPRTEQKYTKLTPAVTAKPPT